MRIGTLLYGFCGGHFGRDSYDKKRVEALGADWVVARNEEGVALFADCRPEELEGYSTDKAAAMHQLMDG